MSNNLNVLVLGAGYMSREYCKVLNSMNIVPLVITNGEKKAQEIKELYKCEVAFGGLEKNRQFLGGIDYAINAANACSIAKTTNDLLNSGIKNILAEKPAGLNIYEIEKSYLLSKELGAKEYVAYNRRFYQSVEKAKEIIQEDGGVQSFHFTFTELGYKIEKLNKDPREFETWFIGNCTHVIDLAFYLGGEPIEMSTYVGGELSWHKDGAIYVGAGKTKDNVFFSYEANWDSPGRWGVELMTKNNRIILKPLEEIQVQKIGSFSVEKLEIDNRIDLDYKAGLYNEVKAFLYGEGIEKLKTIDEHYKDMKIYECMEKGIKYYEK